MNAHPVRNSFQTLWKLGYRTLIPVVPPGAPISERSSIARRLRAGKDDRGKTPGRRATDGLWAGFNWLAHAATEADLIAWDAMGASVGVKTGDLGDGTSLVLLDADTRDPVLAGIVRAIVHERLGILPERIGMDPKAGFLARVSGVVNYCRVEFGRDDTGRPERVEVLSDGRQFVALGTHAKTGKPYAWPNGVPALSDVPIITPEQLAGFMSALVEALPEASPVKTEGADASGVDQASLRADPAVVRQAVEATPNTSEAFPTRDDWRDFGYAIKAAMGPDHEAEALDLFLAWSDKWIGEDGDTNAPDYAIAEWTRFKPPFKRGASWLFERAEALSNGAFSRAQQWFDGAAAQMAVARASYEPLFADEDAEPERKPIRPTPYVPRDVSLIPPREFLYGTHLIRKFVSATVAPSGVGKSSLLIVEALAMASGKPLLGVKVERPLRVWLWNGEDPIDELERRVAAAMQHYGLTAQDIGDRLLIDSGRDTEIILATETRDGAVIMVPTFEELSKALLDFAIDVFIADPFVSSHRVSENDNGAIDLVTKAWAKIAGRTNTAIELVHHVRKLNGAEITVEDSRGAVSLIATSRSARALSKMTKGEAQRLGLENLAKSLFRFGDGKNNLAPATLDTRWMALEGVTLANGAGDGPDRVLKGDSVGVVTLWTPPAVDDVVEADAQTRTLGLIRAGTWRRDIRSGDAWVGVPIAQGMGLDRDDENERARVKAVLAQWLKDGTLVEVMEEDAHRKVRAYVRVAEREEAAGGVFG